jgi:anti-sigma factor RsiW
MHCLSAEAIYGYLDGLLPPAERADLEAHLAGCPACRTAVEARRRMAEAAATLPAFDLPADFADRVMARLDEVPAPAPARGRVGFFAWLAAAAAGFVALGATHIVAAVLAGQSLSHAVATLHGVLWGAIRGAAFYSIKGLKLLVLSVELAVRLIGHALETLKTTLLAMSPVLPAVALGLTALLIVAAGLWLGSRRRYPREENIHEN